MTTQDINEQFMELIHLLEHRAEELRLQELMKDIDARRADWERRRALFVPQKQRLERGGRALELTESFRAIKELRQRLDSAKTREDTLRHDIAEARAKLQNADEAVNLMEGEYREKLRERGELDATVQKVKILDEQADDRQKAALEARTDYDEVGKSLNDSITRTEEQLKELERVEIALREARKFLQQHATDEKLATGLPGIQKSFALYEQAEAKRISLRNELDMAIAKRQEAQAILNDRAALFSEVSTRYTVIEKQHAKARAFYELSLKGKSIDEWRRLCDENAQRLISLDDIYTKFQELAALEGQLKGFQDTKLKLQQDTRNLSLKESEQLSAINSLDEDIAELRKILGLLERIGDLGAVRELLSGSISTKYSSSALPDPAVIREDLAGKESLASQHTDTLTATRTSLQTVDAEIAHIEHDETEARGQISSLNADLAQRISLLGVKFTPGIPPLEELDRERHRTRELLQLARNNAETAETAYKDFMAVEDELRKITQRRSQVSRFHQEALFKLRRLTVQEEHCSNECKAHSEALSRQKRDLISRITPYGWKTVPDTRPEQVIETLTHRLKAWQEGASLCDKLERELSLAQAKMSSLRKERESLRVKHSEALSRLKALEAERDSIRQQRIIMFASRVPDAEQARMNEEIKSLREQLDQRIETRAQRTSELNGIMSSAHSLETEMATGREELHRQEITFSKRMLELGFRNEEDYASSLLTAEERRDLQGKLRELTETDFDLNAERENTQAKILELKGDGLSMTTEELTAKIKALKEASGQATPDDEYIPILKELMLTCGLEEVF